MSKFAREVAFGSRPLVAALAVLALVAPAMAQRQMEQLGRGVVAIHQGDGRVFVSWRLLATDPAGTAFNLYRTTAPGTVTESGPFGSRPDALAGTAGTVVSNHH